MAGCGHIFGHILATHPGEAHGPKAPEMSLPDKPTSSKQKYRLTEKGAVILEELRRQEKQ